MASDHLHAYCKANRDLLSLRQKTREDLREVRQVKKTAQGLLLEMQKEPEVLSTLPDGSAYIVRIKERHARPPRGPEVFQAMEEFWTGGEAEDLKAELEADPTLDPIAEVVQRLAEVAWPPPITRRSLEVKPVKESSSRAQDLPRAPASTQELLSSVIAANGLVRERGGAIKEETQRLKQVCSEVEQRLLPELADLPEGYVRKVNLRGGAGEGDETFFLRLKPPRQTARRKFTDAKVCKALRALLAERALSDRRDATIHRLCSQDFGRTLCRDISELLLREDGTKGPKVVIDRMKSNLPHL